MSQPTAASWLLNIAPWEAVRAVACLKGTKNGLGERVRCNREAASGVSHVPPLLYRCHRLRAEALKPCGGRDQVAAKAGGLSGSDPCRRHSRGCHTSCASTTSIPSALLPQSGCGWRLSKACADLRTSPLSVYRTSSSCAILQDGYLFPHPATTLAR